MKIILPLLCSFLILVSCKKEVLDEETESITNEIDTFYYNDTLIGKWRLDTAIINNEDTIDHFIGYIYTDEYKTNGELVSRTEYDVKNTYTSNYDYYTFKMDESKLTINPEEFNNAYKKYSFPNFNQLELTFISVFMENNIQVEKTIIEKWRRLD